MKVKTNSWHYKLASQWGFPSDSLCRYFWEVMLGVLWIVVAIVILGAIAALALFGLLYPVLRPLFPVLDTAWPVSATVWIGVGMAAITILRDSDMYNHGNHWLCTPISRKKHRPPSLLAEYIHAKKEKICPRIEFDTN